MAETESKAATAQVATDSSFTDDVVRPRGWMYKRIGVGKWNVGWYASPKFQLGMVAFVCFMCPGMFNALGGLGGGGKADAKLADDMVSSRFDFPEFEKLRRASPRTAVACAELGTRAPLLTGY